MKKILYALVLMAILSGAQVYAANMIECRDAGDRMSWVVTLKSNLSIGDHFNNDFSVAMQKTGVDFFETYPPQTEYTLEGKSGKNLIQFVYTKELQKGSLLLNVGTKDEFEVKYECQTAKDDFDWKAVKKALKDAPKNGGSTRY
jgi:hypothetical protein